MTLLEFEKRSTSSSIPKTKNLLPWLGYCAFHNYDYIRAIEVYDEILSLPNSDKI